MLSHPQGTPSKAGTAMVQAWAPAIQTAYPEPHPQVSDMRFSALSNVASPASGAGGAGWEEQAAGRGPCADHLPEGTHGQSARQPP